VSELAIIDLADSSNHDDYYDSTGFVSVSLPS
jgi:hypothetical protein